MRDQSHLRSRGRIAPQELPLIRAVPAVGLRSPASRRSSVVFPAPFGPKSARHSRSSSARVTSCTARRPPNDRVRPSACQHARHRALEAQRHMADEIMAQRYSSPSGTALAAALYTLLGQGSLGLGTTDHRPPTTVHRPPSTVPCPKSTPSSTRIASSRRRDEFRRDALVSDPAIYDARHADPEASGQRRPTSSSGSRSGTRCSTGSRRTRSGSSAASSTSRCNCVDRHVATARAQQGGAHLGGRARRSRARSRTGSCYVEVQKFANVLKKLGVKRATASRSTCR